MSERERGEPMSAMENHIEKITPHIGATLHGVTLSPDMDPASIDTVQSAIDNNLVVVLPNQDLSAADLRDTVKQFGEIFLHHADEGVLFADGLTEVLEMRKEADGERLFGGEDWYTDISFRNPGGHLSFLHAKIIPPIGGDTGFASTIAAFDALSDGMKSMLRPLKAVHSYDGPFRPEHADQTAIHPVIRRHPVTGAEGLFVNRMFTTRFEGMTHEESWPLIEFLDRHMSKPEFTCRVSWRPGHVTIWDNRFTLHYPINDFVGYQRLLLRCSTLEAA